MPRAGHYPHKPATIKDIARELNISISTVSRVLRDMPDVNSETRQSVLQMVEKLDYQPNQIALSLVTKHTHTLGVIVPNLDYFFSTAVRGMDDMALEAGYTAMICQSNETYGKPVEGNSIEHLISILNRSKTIWPSEAVHLPSKPR